MKLPRDPDRLISCHSSSPDFLYLVRLLRIWYAEAEVEADEADEVGRKWVVKVRVSVECEGEGVGEGEGFGGEMATGGSIVGFCLRINDVVCEVSYLYVFILQDFLIYFTCSLKLYDIYLNVGF